MLDMNAWWNYLLSHLRDSGLNNIYMDGSAGAVALALTAGYGIIDGVLWDINSAGVTEVLAIGWDQAEVDTATANAVAYGLTVVRTLRVFDNVMTVL